ncbi:hypothetical protein R3W88_014350 [Solanum pinnatisectum]|uniref:F-box domain-containing protein n=1 Tax=Solanum pinnatisectum TaxID=50273 RepID=A0AAV9KSH4_9SOLN|nr:hypothetical protein R3W88_014350 [Solanum pinnatisectum]
MQKGKRQKLIDIAIDGESEAPDLISKLPDEVLHSIISFLSLTIVDKVLSSLSFNVNFFHLCHSPQTWVCSDYMLRWIDNEPIISSCIKWLIRSNSGEQVVRSVIPKGNIFQGRFLQFVELNEYVLIDGLPFKGCVNVKTLKLKACLLMGKNTLVEILENCKELEKLTLRQCSYHSHNYNIGPSRGRCFLSIIASVLDALPTYTMTNFVGISTRISTRKRRGGENIFINSHYKNSYTLKFEYVSDRMYPHCQKENQLGIA